MSELKPIIPIASPGANAQAIARHFMMQNVQIVNAQKNPYESKIPGAVTIDPALYKSSLGTLVFSDLTFGDKVNKNNNQWTDNDGKLRSFEPVTLVAVLMEVSRAKRIVKTEIQGRSGTVKEYIGEDDYQIDIKGVITGANGHYPIDEVKKLKAVFDAPIPIVVSSWYLQNLDIDTIVIEDRSFGQDAGGYSYQSFTVKAISDTPVELKVI